MLYFLDKKGDRVIGPLKILQHQTYLPSTQAEC